MPNRVIKESICESQNLNECSLFARDLFTRLITYADDFGRFNADLKILRARLYPLESETIRLCEIEEAIIELATNNLVVFYGTCGGIIEKVKVFGKLIEWERHQRVRNVRSKCPAPDHNGLRFDWSVRRAIPADLKDMILSRDGYGCVQCGFSIKFKQNLSPVQKRKRLGGLLHIDHIVPVVQGGRATEENLRVLCIDCNEKRPRKLTVEEITGEFNATCIDLPQVAADCGLNPNPNPNPFPPTPKGGEFEKFWATYPKKFSKGQAEKAWRTLRPTEQLVVEILQGVERAKKSVNWQKDGGQFIPYPATWLRSKGWEDEYPETIVDPRTGIEKRNPAYDPPPGPQVISASRPAILDVPLPTAEDLKRNAEAVRAARRELDSKWGKMGESFKNA